MGRAIIEALIGVVILAAGIGYGRSTMRVELKARISTRIFHAEDSHDRHMAHGDLHAADYMAGMKAGYENIVSMIRRYGDAESGSSHPFRARPRSDRPHRTHRHPGTRS